MSLRKNFDSFTPRHKLQDAQEEFAQAVYGFRSAEDANAPNRYALMREMESLDRKVQAYRYCVYTGQPIEGYVDYLAAHVGEYCPKPAWG